MCRVLNISAGGTSIIHANPLCKSGIMIAGFNRETIGAVTQGTRTKKAFTRRVNSGLKTHAAKIGKGFFSTKY